MENGFENLIAQARHNRQKLGRSISTEIYRPEGGLLAITKMHDDFHDLQLALKVDAGTLVLEDLAIRMERIPYKACVQAIPSFEKLKGVRLVERGITRSIRKLVGRPLGCTHIFEMLDICLSTIFAEAGLEAVHPILEGLEIDERQQMAILNPFFTDTCVAFSRAALDPAISAAAQKKVQKNIEGGAPLDAFNSLMKASAKEQEKK
jgi:hypothetical protein